MAVACHASARASGIESYTLLAALRPPVISKFRQACRHCAVSSKVPCSVCAGFPSTREMIDTCAAATGNLLLEEEDGQVMVQDDLDLLLQVDYVVLYVPLPVSHKEPSTPHNRSLEACQQLTPSFRVDAFLRDGFRYTILKYLMFCYPLLVVLHTQKRNFQPFSCLSACMRAIHAADSVWPGLPQSVCTHFAYLA